jgi:formate/nitrite transporter FocA (FNT family)
MSKLSDDFSADEKNEVAELSGPGAPIIYEVITQEGNEELSRSLRSLFWSGVAAGLLISVSIYAEATLRSMLPDTAWRGLIENIGYSVGFIIVVMGRLQLFTENTITTVAPLLVSPSRGNLYRTARLWAIVYLANMIGTFAAAIYFYYLPVTTVEIRTAMESLSLHIFEFSIAQNISRGILAGVLIATMVWILPNAKHNAFWVILLFTYLIALGDLTHVIAGSVEAFYVFLMGDISLARAIASYIFPTLAGNVVGGTLVFTLLVYAQISPDLPD